MTLKQDQKRSFIYLISKIISAGLSLISISIFTRIFDADTYGSYLLFISYVILICSLFFSWHRLSVYRYYHRFKNNYQSYIKTSYLSFTVIIIILAAGAFLAYLLPIKVELKILIYFCALASIFKSNFDLNQSIFNISRSDDIFGLNIIIRPLLFILFNLFFYYYIKEQEYTLIYSFIFSFLIISIISDFLILKNSD
ncbi:uncharacterized protein METZ01_LOCUS291256, partial [marine metagenome]